MVDIFKDLLIFEMANNHQGNIKHAEYIIRKIGAAARKHNLNAGVKFQYRDLDTLVHPDYKNRTDIAHIPRFYSTKMNFDEYYSLVRLAKEEGLLAICTAFDEISVEFCMDHGIEIMKIASCSATDWPLLEKAAETQKPIIISTGGKTFSDIDKIYNFFTHRGAHFALLHCVGIYPVANHQVQLNCVDRMISRYPDISIGYSGHEDPKNTVISQMAIAKGASVLERHVGHSTEKIALNAYSTEVDDIELWIDAIKSARDICGEKNKKKIEEVEIKSLNSLSRGCYCAKPILKGQKITKEYVYFAMPCEAEQTTSGQYQDNMAATKDYAVNEAIFERRPVSIITDTRSIIHDIKGMLYEAKVVIGNEFELELSHHYGLEHFRNYGATIINIINREYCKKIIVVLAGQKHPTHFHKIKEETFQVLSGVLKLQLDEQEINIVAGKIVTIERGVKHSFTSSTGCIFEEISTTHRLKDSFYDDPLIAQIDAMSRKTILKDW
jgi:N-acetylneuraminate synthase